MANPPDNDQAARNSYKQLAPGVKLVHTFAGHTGAVYGVAFHPKGRTFASGSSDSTAKIWDVRSGKLLRTLAGHEQGICSIKFDPRGGVLATGSGDKTVRLWEAGRGQLLWTLKKHPSEVWSVAFDPQGRVLASGGLEGTLNLWNARSGKLVHSLKGHNIAVIDIAFDSQGATLASGGGDNRVKVWEVQSGSLVGDITADQGVVWSVAFQPGGSILASGGNDRTIKLWECRKSKLVRTLEGHTDRIEALAFSSDGRLLASKSEDHTIRLWDCETWEPVGILREFTRRGYLSSLDFHPSAPLLASPGSEPGAPEEERCRLIHLWELDYDRLLRRRAERGTTARAVHHTTGKIMLVGDHSVGKSALGHRMIHGQFEKQESSHGQQFWVFPALGKRRADGTECEAILWDFAGQPDYRLVHALFVDNADLALVLFDASDLRDPLHGVGFWLKQLQVGQSRCPIILVAAQTDRGTCSLTADELKAFCEKHGIVGPIATSAFSGAGMHELVERMKSLISWDEKAATVTTTTFKRIKDYVLALKEGRRDRQVIVTPAQLRDRLEITDSNWHFTDAEMLTTLGHLENYGYVRRLRTSKGEPQILLQPERLNNLASSFVLEARRNPKGLGALEEKRLLTGGYDFLELKDLSESERDALLDSAALLFLEHNVCFRETDPLRMEPYLVFPELINLKRPPEDEKVTEDGVAYTVSGPTENVFASLVVLLGYTHTFTRTAQWHNNARYEVGHGLVCGFRQEAERDGELDFVLGFGHQVGLPVRTLFQGLFESFLARRNLTVMRYDPVRCSNGHFLNRVILREAMDHGDEVTFCSKCGAKLTLPKKAEPIQLTREVQVEVEAQRRAAEQRTRFEQAVFRVRAFFAEQEIKPPECFISYAWGVPEHERWVEKRLAVDLQKSGISVLLDRWDMQIGSSVARFVERIEECDRVIVVGTPLYRQKAKNVASTKGSVVAAEWDLAGIRLLAAEDHKRTVLPVLLAGEESESFPALMRGRVYGDFRNEEGYFTTAFDLILSLYQLPPNHIAVADLRESLRGAAMDRRTLQNLSSSGA